MKGVVVSVVAGLAVGLGNVGLAGGEEGHAPAGRARAVEIESVREVRHRTVEIDGLNFSTSNAQSESIVMPPT